MSFSMELKREILANKPMRARFSTAQAYGLFLYGRAFDEDEISLRTESADTAALFRRFARDLLGKRVLLERSERGQGSGTVITMSIPQGRDRCALIAAFGHSDGINRDILPTREHVGAFLAGAYLACGNLTDPEKAYHMEFVVRDSARSKALVELLTDAVPGVRMGGRGRSDLVYYKECAAIEDLMTLMGATRSCLAMIDVETFKSVRNKANRAVNCETANIDKLVGAATSQIEDIQLILREKGEDSLPEPLRTAAKLRLENPEASLRELAELSPEPVSRSGMHHRLDKLGRIAAEIRRIQEGAGENE